MYTHSHLPSSPLPLFHLFHSFHSFQGPVVQTQAAGYQRWQGIRAQRGKVDFVIIIININTASEGHCEISAQERSVWHVAERAHAC
jgi:hypothetical protein